MSLLAVKDYAQQLADAITAILKLDIAIIDKNLERLAGTGPQSDCLGQAGAKRGNIYSEVLSHGCQLVLAEPGKHQHCLKCLLKASCSAKTKLISPIKIRGEVVGAIDLTCCIEDQAQLVGEKVESYLLFLAKMAETIALKVNEREFGTKIGGSNSYLMQEDSFYMVNDILGDSLPMRELREQTKTIALSKSTVLIRGESGTGKGVLARAIHNLSPRRQGPFVAINCTAIPEALLESELFGYEEGAFTGARKGGKIGKFELANNGTLFLDEIGDMPLFLQAKMLRVLQERQVERIGGLAPIPVDVRVIAATHRDLEQMMTRREFREDLYYRINVIPVAVAPLRQRKEDLDSLCLHFITGYNHQLNKQVVQVSEESRQKLMQYNWPGNVRELQNAIEYAMNLAEGTVLEAEYLPQKIRQFQQGTNAQVYNLEALERETIRRCLEEFGNSVQAKEQAAAALGIGIATLYRKIARYGLSQISETTYQNDN